MSEKILDATQKKRRPVPVVITGLICAVVSLLITAVIIYISEYLQHEIHDKYIDYFAAAFLINIVLLTAIGMFLVAAWGQRKNHFFKILGTGLISYQAILAGLLGYTFIDSAIRNINIQFFDMLLFKVIAGGEILVLVLAIIFWLIPGKLPYFRKQMEP